MSKTKIERKHWILAGITLSNAAKSLLAQVETLQDASGFGFKQTENVPRIGAPEGFGATQMLLALSIEMALKAWIVFDKNDSKVFRGHDLSKLFGQLNLSSREKLEHCFRSEIASEHPNFFNPNHNLAALLEQHKNAFQEWRYFYEMEQLHMNTAEFMATTKMILNEFDKRHGVA
jgi:hypothetical protein